MFLFEQTKHHKTRESSCSEFEVARKVPEDGLWALGFEVEQFVENLMLPASNPI